MKKHHIAGIVAVIAVAATASALAASGSVRISGGGIDAVDVVAHPGATGGARTWKTILSAEVAIPAGTSALLLARYTAVTSCQSALTAATCTLRLRVGEVGDPSPATFGYAHLSAAEARAQFAVESAEFVTGPLPAGTYTVTVDGRSSDETFGGRFSNQLLVLEQLRAGSAPVRPPRPIVQTRTATAPDFDASLVDPEWQTIASTRLEVPSGQTNLLLARFSAASQCSDANGPVDPPPHQPCEAVIRVRRIVPGGFQFVSTFPERIRFDDTGDETYRAQRMETVTEPLTAGTYEILVRGNQAHYWKLRTALLVVDRVNLVFGTGLKGERWW